INGAIKVNTEFSPYEEAPASADQYPKSFRRVSAPLYVPAEILQAATEKVKSRRGSAAQRKPLDPLAAATVSRLFVRGAVVIDRLRSRYRESDKRSPEMDRVFEPDAPFTANRIVEEERVSRFLEAIYPSSESTLEEKARATRVVSVATELWPSPQE